MGRLEIWFASWMKRAARPVSALYITIKPFQKNNFGLSIQLVRSVQVCEQGQACISHSMSLNKLRTPVLCHGSRNFMQFIMVGGYCHCEITWRSSFTPCTKSSLEMKSPSTLRFPQSSNSLCEITRSCKQFWVIMIWDLIYLAYTKTWFWLFKRPGQISVQEIRILIQVTGLLDMRRFYRSSLNLQIYTIFCWQRTTILIQFLSGPSRLLCCGRMYCTTIMSWKTANITAVFMTPWHIEQLHQ